MKSRRALAVAAVLAALAGALAAGWLAPAKGTGTVVRTAHAEAELVSARTAIEPGAALRVALRLKPDAGWHTYWRNPGDSGQPTTLEWRLPPGYRAGAIGWPAPQRIPIGALANYGYKAEVLLPVEIRVPADAKGSARIAALAKWLVCSPERCVPESAELALELPVGSGAPGRWADALAALELPRPVPAGWKLAARRDGDRVLLDLSPVAAEPLLFFPYEEGKIRHAAAQGAERTADGMRLAIPVAAQPVGEFTRLAGVLAAGDRAYEVDVPIEQGRRKEMP